MMISSLSRRLLAGANPPGPLSLMYHSVGGDTRKEAWPWRLPLKQFSAQLDMLASHDWRTITIGELVDSQRSAGPREIAITFDDGYVDNLAACAELVRRGMRASWFVVTNCLGRDPGWDDAGRPVQRLLDATELRSMQALGMEIGSHGCSHRRLPALDDLTLSRELTESRAALEDILGAPVTSFAFPYGAVDARSKSAVRAAGYAAACTTQSGWALHDHDALSVRRLTVFSDDTADTLARKIALATNDASVVRIAKYACKRALTRLVGQ